MNIGLRGQARVRQGAPNQRGKRLADSALPVLAIRGDRQPDAGGRLPRREGHPGAAFSLQPDQLGQRVPKAADWSEANAKATWYRRGRLDIASELEPRGFSVPIVGGGQGAYEVVVLHGH